MFASSNMKPFQTAEATRFAFRTADRVGSFTLMMRQAGAYGPTSPLGRKLSAMQRR
jgi:hypothetical protein